MPWPDKGYLPIFFYTLYYLFIFLPKFDKIIFQTVKERTLETQYFSDVSQTGFCSEFCGWHDNHGNYTYAWVGVSNSSCGCFSQQNSPNGDFGVDAAVSCIAHELAETVTDPYGTGWFYEHGSNFIENGDQCAWYFPGQAPGTNYNIIVGGLKYLIQANWNLNTKKCAMS